MDGGRGAGADRRGADIAVNRGGGETNDIVMEEERQGVGESSGGLSARVPVEVAVTEEKGGADRGGRQAEKGRDTHKNVMERGGSRGEEGETTSVLARCNFDTPLRRCWGVGVSNR